MAEHDAGQRLHLDIAQGVFLMLREIAHLFLGEFDVRDVARGQLAHGGANFRVRQAVIRAVPIVELDRQFAHGVIAPLGDVGQDGFNGCANFRLILGAVCGAAAGFQMNGHVALLT